MERKSNLSRRTHGDVPVAVGAKGETEDRPVFFASSGKPLPEEMAELMNILMTGGYSCVIRNGDKIRTFTKRGVADLYHLLQDEPDFLNGAMVADKVVGKGAASLLILGDVRRVCALVMSDSALALLRRAGVETDCGEKVAYIRNRAGTGYCPVESLCAQAATAEEALPLIERFLASLR